jgi:uncharacterized protein with FMN-binding domain
MLNGKKLAIGGIVVILLGGYALWASTRTAAPTTADQTPTGGQVGGTSAPSETTNPNATAGQYKDGVYTGAIGSAAPYGTVQVKATISGGKLTSISLVQKPQGPGETNEIAARAFPILVQEAIAVQSANVHIVSGATQDSEGFQQSLSSALTQAQS